jgi:hypothetical protein
MKSTQKCALIKAFLLVMTFIVHADNQLTTTSNQQARTVATYTAPQQRQSVSEIRIRRRRHTKRCCRQFRTSRYRHRYRRRGYIYGPAGPYWSYYGWPGTYDYGIYGGVGFGGSFYI